MPGSGDPDGTRGAGDSSSSNSDDGVFTQVARWLSPDTADSIPVPLLVLAGLALLLMAAAFVSFVTRRVQAKRATPDPPPPSGISTPLRAAGNRLRKRLRDPDHG